MEVILQEKVQNLGQLGDCVKVSNGYARNFLIPRGVAVPATDEHRKAFEARREELEKHAKDALLAATKRASSLRDLTVTIKANTMEEGKLYGSVGTREIAEAATEAGHELCKSEIQLPTGPIHQVGEYDIRVHLHTDVECDIHVNVVPQEDQ